MRATSLWMALRSFKVNFISGLVLVVVRGIIQVEALFIFLEKGGTIFSGVL